ncbi:sensor histidine kinase [Thermodesulfovibrio hydrogeniphilus]
MLTKIKQFFAKLTEERYFYLKFRLILLNTFFAIIPLAIVITITYFWIYQLVNDDFKNNLSSQMEETQHSIEFFISQKMSALRFLASSYPENYFTDEKRFYKLFTNFRREFVGIVDMGVINSQGIQILYCGPYKLKGKDYSDTEWFNEMKLKTEYVTDVFLGYRKIPHFSIIIKKEFPSQNDFILLRVSINMDILERYLKNLQITSQDDAFLLNNKGVLQTNSKFFGNAMETVQFVNIKFDFNISNVNIQKLKIHKKEAYIAYTPIKNTNWILVTKIFSKPYEKIPAFFTKEVTLISFFSIVVIFFVITTSISHLVNRLQKLDQEKEIAIANAEHADKLASIGRLAAGVAHEINNPLAIINEKAGLMKDLLEYGDLSQNKDRFIQLISSIQDAVTRCKTITHRLLSFSKKIDRAREEFYINEAIKEVVSFIEKEIQAKDIEIIYDFNENIPKIITDKGQLQQVLLNIINNAVDAVDIGGQIEIKTEIIDSNHVRISIKDNGPGIPRDKLKHIFEPFYTTKKKGTGLGLYISYGIIKKLGGDIKVESKVGKGTTFYIELPINPDLEEIKCKAKF